VKPRIIQPRFTVSASFTPREHAWSPSLQRATVIVAKSVPTSLLRSNVTRHAQGCAAFRQEQGVKPSVSNITGENARSGGDVACGPVDLVVDEAGLTRIECIPFDHSAKMRVLQIQLRMASAQEAADFFLLYKATLGAYFEQTLGWNEHFRRAAFRISYPVYKCQAIVVDGGETPAGVLVLEPHPDGALEVALLLVARRFQGAGIGSRVLQNVCRNALGGGRAVRLKTFLLNQGATRFYLRSGFVVVGEDAHYLYFSKSA